MSRRVFNSRNEKKILEVGWWCFFEELSLMSWHSEKPWLLSVITHWMESQGVSFFSSSSSTLHKFIIFPIAQIHWFLFYHKNSFLFTVIKRFKIRMDDDIDCEKRKIENFLSNCRNEILRCTAIKNDSNF